MNVGIGRVEREAPIQDAVKPVGVRRERRSKREQELAEELDEDIQPEASGVANATSDLEVGSRVDVIA